MPRYLDPKADVVFKKIFGEHPHLLKSFLNAILPLPEDGPIESLEYLSAEQVPVIPNFKRTLVDVKCTDKRGFIFIVEMQMEWTGSFMQRLLFTSATAYVSQLQKGADYKFLCPVYGLGILNDIFERDTDAWYHHYQIVNVENPLRQLEGLEFVFLELPKFKPATREQKHLRVLWLRFLSELDEKTKVVSKDLLAIPEIEEACALSEEAAYSPGELQYYNSYWDEVSRNKSLISGNYDKGKLEGKIEGFIEGEIKGKIEGKLEGKLEGKIEGKLEGKIEGKLEVARELLALNMSISDVVKATGLSEANIERLTLLPTL